MPNRQYEKGRRFEYAVIDDLFPYNYVTIRAAHSAGEGKVDIIAIHPTGVQLWIQCKADGNLPISEWNQLRKCARWIHAVPILASRPGRGKILYEKLCGPRVAYQGMFKEPFDIRIQYA